MLATRSLGSDLVDLRRPPARLRAVLRPRIERPGPLRWESRRDRVVHGAAGCATPATPLLSGGPRRRTWPAMIEPGRRAARPRSIVPGAAARERLSAASSAHARPMQGRTPSRWRAFHRRGTFGRRPSGDASGEGIECTSRAGSPTPRRTGSGSASDRRPANPPVEVAGLGPVRGPAPTPLRPPPMDFPRDRLDGRPVIYASLGIRRTRVAAAFRMIAEACDGLDARFVISIGRESRRKPSATCRVEPSRPPTRLGWSCPASPPWRPPTPA